MSGAADYVMFPFLGKKSQVLIKTVELFSLFVRLTAGEHIEKRFSPMKKLTALSLSALMISGTFLCFTQQAQAWRHGVVNRQNRQQRRISKGIENGSLTGREASHLDRQQVRLNKQETNMRAGDDGHLTRQDRNTLEHEQNRDSRDIYYDKHNDHNQ